MQVDWTFKCGCHYQGLSYLIYGRRWCKEHFYFLESEIITCQTKTCGKKFKIKSKGRSPKFCPECQKEKHRYIRKNEEPRPEDAYYE